MREIVNIQVGQCGNNIGTQFWEAICGEHELDQNGMYFGKNPREEEKLSTYFSETKGCTYVPRSVMVDFEIYCLDAVRSSPYGKTFRPENFVLGSNGTSNIWPRGHFTEGLDVAGSALDVVRREVENCDCFHGFQIVHSVGGGTGGGLGSLLICGLRDEYPDRTLNTFSILPINHLMIESYNAVLTLNHLIESCHETYCMDNEAIFEILAEKLRAQSKTYADANKLVALVMSGVTTCLRFPASSQHDFRKIAVNMIPYPRLHFFVPGFAPLTSRENITLRKLTVTELISDLFDSSNLFASCDPKKGKYLTVGCIFRGNISTKELDRQISNIHNRSSRTFVEWIPSNIKTAICYVPSPGFSKSGVFIGNTTSIQHTFKTIRNQFLALYKRKAFLHLYFGDGMEALEFEESVSNLNDLVLEYEENEKYVSEIQEINESSLLQENETKSESSSLFKEKETDPPNV